MLICTTCSEIMQKKGIFKQEIRIYLFVGNSNKCAVNMKIMTRTLQTEANVKFGKEKVKKTVIFLDKTFF